MTLDVDELARALRAYVGPYPSPDNIGVPTWYLDFNSMATDEEIRRIAEDIVAAASEGIELGCSVCGRRNGCPEHFHLGPRYERKLENSTR